MQSWLFWNALSNQDGLELTGICLFPEPRARPRACKFRVNLVTHTRHTRDSTLEGDGKKDRKDKKKICVKWEGKWVSGLRYWPTVPNNTSTSTELWGDLLSPTTPPPPLSYEVTWQLFSPGENRGQVPSPPFCVLCWLSKKGRLWRPHLCALMLLRSCVSIPTAEKPWGTWDISSDFSSLVSHHPWVSSCLTVSTDLLTVAFPVEEVK